MFCQNCYFYKFESQFKIFTSFSYKTMSQNFGKELNRNFGPYRKIKMNRNLGLGFGSKPNFGLNLNLNIPITSHNMFTMLRPNKTH